jgi:hypothetical protein
VSSLIHNKVNVELGRGTVSNRRTNTTQSIIAAPLSHSLDFALHEQEKDMLANMECLQSQDLAQDAYAIIERIPQGMRLTIIIS